MSNPFSLKEIQGIPDFELIKPSWALASDGVPLAYYLFELACRPQAIIIMYHGGGFYSNKTYQYIGHELKKNYAIVSCLVDIRGHGHSAGPRGDAPSIDQLFKDVDSVIELVKKQNPGIPIYLVGHSSGAGLLINYNAYSPRTPIDGYIFLAPYLGPNSGTLRMHDNLHNSFVKK